MTLSETTQTALIALVRSVAVSEIVPRFRRLSDDAVSTKTGPEDLVTEADLHAEAAIAAGVRTLLPDALIVGEEAAETHPEVLDELPDAPLAVIIDPVDGTWNFAKGLTTFGVILAVTVRGETVFGLLYDPIMDDWVLARRGGGTWYGTADGALRRLTFSKAPANGLTGFVPLFQYPLQARARLVGEVDGIRRIWSVRCSCHEYRTLVTGGADFGVSGELKPWDHAAGALAVEEAGGAVSLLDGRPYTLAEKRSALLVSARSPEILAQVRAVLARLFADAN